MWPWLRGFVTHATQAIVHAADDTSVMETLEALPHVIRSTRAIAGAARYRIGPASIGMPDGTYAGVESPIDTYVWRIDLKELNGKKRTVFGHVNLVR